MNATRKVKLKDITANLTCSLCKGYIIDATTSIECLHSFCKSCIVQHLEKSEYCPVCDVQLHSTKPLSGIRSDQMLQEIIYKLVPGLFQSEMQRRRRFYNEHENSHPSSQHDSGQIFNQFYITSYDKINISLEYYTDDVNVKDDWKQGGNKRYYHCPAEVSVSVLKKLVQLKFDLKKDLSDIDIMYGERILPDDFLLMDIAYKYSWSDSGTKPLQLMYRVKSDVPPSQILTNKLRSPTKSPAKRRSRAVTDSEILKSSNRNISIQEESPQPQPLKLTPNGNKRGRKKRNLILNEKNSPVEVEPKKKKINKKDSTPIKNKNLNGSESPITKTNVGVGLGSMEKEVQLRISENGIISATSVGSGEEKIIGNWDTSPSPPMKNASGESHLQATASASASTTTTNFNANENTNMPLPEISINTGGQMNGNSPMTKPTFVTLNIPTFTFGINGISPLNAAISTSATAQMPLPLPISIPSFPYQNGNESPQPPQPKSQSFAGAKKIPTPSKGKVKSTKKISKNKSNGAEQSSTFQKKKANVQKALFDMKKIHLPNGNGNASEPLSQVSMSANKLGNGMIATTSTNRSQQNPNGLSTNPDPLASLPFQLSALSSSGMTVNVISFQDIKSNNGLLKGKPNVNVNAASNSNSSPQHGNGSDTKRPHQNQTIVLNGDSKFKSSPRPILPSPSKNLGTGMNVNGSPKFFKSRHSSSHSHSSSDQESPMKEKLEKQEKLKEHHKNPNPKSIAQPQSQSYVSLNGHFHPNGGLINSTNSSKPSASASTITTPSCSTTPSTSVSKSSPIPFNPLLLYQMNPLFNQLNPFAPFVTNDYISMPQVNNRLPFASEFSFPLPFTVSQQILPLPNTNFTQMAQPQPQANNSLPTASTSGKYPSSSSPSKSGSQAGPKTMVNQNQTKESSDSTDDHDRPLSLKVVVTESSVSPTVTNHPISTHANNNGKHQLPFINGHTIGNGNTMNMKTSPKVLNGQIEEKKNKKIPVSGPVVNNGNGVGDGESESNSDAPLNLQIPKENGVAVRHEKSSEDGAKPEVKKARIEEKVKQSKSETPKENGHLEEKVKVNGHCENGNDSGDSNSKNKVKEALLKAIGERAEKMQEITKEVRAEAKWVNDNDKESEELKNSCNNNNNPPSTPDLNVANPPTPTLSLSSNSA